MTQVYNNSPLPFQGQKRNFAAIFRSEVAALPDDTVFVDLFGGSGLLSRAAKDARPQSRVIYNDFDDFHLRIKAVPTTNAILAELRKVFAGSPPLKRVPNETRAQALEIIEAFDRNGFVDYISLSSSVLFSGNYAVSLDDLKKCTFYNCLRQSDFHAAENYLNGLEIRKADYKEIFAEFKDNPKAFFICDPPYLSTQNEAYECYWKLPDFLDVLNCLKGTKFAFFTSDKSSLIELLEWLDRNEQIQNPFIGAKRIDFDVQINRVARYKDIMIFKAG